MVVCGLDRWGCTLPLSLPQKGHLESVALCLLVQSWQVSGSSGLQQAHATVRCLSQQKTHVVVSVLTESLSMSGPCCCAVPLGSAKDSRSAQWKQFPVQQLPWYGSSQQGVWNVSLGGMFWLQEVQRVRLVGVGSGRWVDEYVGRLVGVVGEEEGAALGRGDWGDVAEVEACAESCSCASIVGADWSSASVWYGPGIQPSSASSCDCSAVGIHSAIPSGTAATVVSRGEDGWGGQDEFVGRPRGCVWE